MIGDVLTHWPLWLMWGGAMLALGWGLGLRRGRLRALGARHDVLVAMQDGWATVMKVYQPGVDARANGRVWED